ncbi:dihydroorotase [Candidatus Micrarchaeota archaeon]|nr:dihydroorotase [Candidatus Micrarchaeota archaeon]
MNGTNAIMVKNGLVVEPVSKTQEIRNVKIKNGKITSDSLDGAREFDAEGLIVMPGWIDLHTHTRDPGFTHKEDLDSASKAAIAGGYATIVAMPNTKPVVDNPSVVDFVLQKSKNLEANVFCTAAITLGQTGEELVDFMALKNAGAVYFTDDGNPVQDAKVMRNALAEAKKAGVLLAQHCEDRNAIRGCACMGEGAAAKLGFKGFPREAEFNCVERDLQMVEELGAREHFLHMSLKESVDAIAKAKAKGLQVTAEATPHHFALTEGDLLEKAANAKMNPPLRDEKDARAVREGLKSGVFDVIGTDHAPHTAEEKAGGWEKAPNGIVGLETAVALCITHLVETKTLSWLQLAEKTSLNPAKLINCETKGSLKPGFDADVTIIDPELEWTVDASKFKSKSKNTPWDGVTLKGKAVAVIAKGILYELR